MSKKCNKPQQFDENLHVRLPVNESSDDDNEQIYKRQAIKAAKDFNYGDDVIEQLKAANNSSEIEYIMRNARHKKWG